MTTPVSDQERQRLLVENMRLVDGFLQRPWVVALYARFGGREELRANLWEFYVRAVDNWRARLRHKRHLRLSGYVYRWLRWCLTELARERRLIRIPERMNQRFRQARQHALRIERCGRQRAEFFFGQPDDRWREGTEAAEWHEEIALCLEGLPRRWQAIVQARFGVGGRRPQLLRALARRYGVSKERIRQIEAKALGRLRAELLRRGTLYERG